MEKYLNKMINQIIEDKIEIESTHFFAGGVNIWITGEVFNLGITVYKEHKLYKKIGNYVMGCKND